MKIYLTSDYKDIIEIFTLHEVKFLIAGAFAMSNLGYSRGTGDIDLWVEKSKENAIKIYHALEDFGIPFEIKPDDFMRQDAIVQIGVEPNRIDIITDIDGVLFDNAWKNKVELELDGIKTYSLSLEDLIINKSSTSRQKDKLDLVQLKQLSQQIKKTDTIRFDRNLTNEIITDELEKITNPFKKIYSGFKSILPADFNSQEKTLSSSLLYHLRISPIETWSNFKKEHLHSFLKDTLSEIKPLETMGNSQVFANENMLFDNNIDDSSKEQERVILELAGLIDNLIIKIEQYKKQQSSFRKSYAKEDVLKIDERPQKYTSHATNNIKAVANNAPNISILKKDNDYYIASNSSEMDINQAAYSYLQIDGKIPENMINNLKLDANTGLSQEGMNELQEAVILQVSTNKNNHQELLKARSQEKTPSTHQKLG